MDLSFYTAAVGANAQQGRMNVIANNLANINTEGYKSQSAGFVDLLYNKYYKAATKDPETGCGARVEKTDILYEQAGTMPTGGAFDFAISGEGFFAVYDPGTGDVFYTRNGHFSMSNYGENLFYLVDDEKRLVLSKDFNIIRIDPSEQNQEPDIGVFDFNSKEGMLLKGNNNYMPVDKNGSPFLNERAVLARGRLEMSNVDLAYEMSRVIETQRAYQMTLKMVQTSDEIEQTINNLR
ncbi:MAG: flagellar hook-basal body protein [Clostridiales bacterium]|nr:flagellar hook-basal body protein [Clostridiales bacterium]